MLCLTINHLYAGLRSAFSVVYLDNVTIDGAMEGIVDNLSVIKEAEEIGLTLNNGN